MPEWDTWYPDVGTEALILGIMLLAVAALLIWLGIGLKVPQRAGVFGKTTGIFLMVLSRCQQLAIFPNPYRISVTAKDLTEPFFSSGEEFMFTPVPVIPVMPGNPFPFVLFLIPNKK